jgi:hypothetical protein
VNTVLNIAFAMLFLFVLVWVLIFGGIGAVLSRSREGTAVAGFVLGTLLGPIGWGVVFWKTRASHRPTDSGAWLRGPDDASSRPLPMSTADCADASTRTTGGSHDY